MRLTDNFGLAEMQRSDVALRHGLDNQAPKRCIQALRALCTCVLEPLRQRFGPVRILSGYRSPALNTLVGGSPNSQHMCGEAADIEIVGVANDVIIRWLAAAQDIDFDQLIAEHGPDGWVHVSFRAAGNRRQQLRIG